MRPRIFTAKGEPLIVETDASDFAIAATLNQMGRPVAYYQRTISEWNSGEFGR